MKAPVMLTLATALAMGNILFSGHASTPLNTAIEVVDYVPGDHGGLFDWVNGDLYTNALYALGSPTVDTTGDDGYIPADEVVPTVPLYPAFRASELVVVGQGGHLVLKFDTPVTNDPMNPYGIDFIVFGNAFYSIGSNQPWTNRDPNAAVLGSTFIYTPGLVSVSQDGSNWVAYASGPYAGRYAPTLGRIYDPDNPDPGLGEWNNWWGAPTDPSYPLDPAIVASNLVGRTVAEVARLYRGSAGGVGFDIDDLDLPPDPETGLKWVRFVRIEPVDQLNIKVDALVATRPASPFRHWQHDHFSWLDHLAEESPHADPGAKGLPNALAYALGEDPWETEAFNAFESYLDLDESPPSLKVVYVRNPDATDAGLLVEFAPNPLGIWTADDVDQEFDVETLEDGRERVTARAPMEQSKGLLRLKVVVP